MAEIERRRGDITLGHVHKSPFDSRDEAALMRQRAQLTDEPVPVVAVSRNGFECSSVNARYDPRDLIKAW